MPDFLSLDPLNVLVRLTAAPKVRHLCRFLYQDRLSIPVTISDSALGQYPVDYDTWRIKTKQLCWKFEIDHPGSHLVFAEALPRSSARDTPLSCGMYAALSRVTPLAELRSLDHYELDHLLRLLQSVREYAALAAAMYESASVTGSCASPPPVDTRPVLVGKPWPKNVPKPNYSG